METHRPVYEAYKDGWFVGVDKGTGNDYAVSLYKMTRIKKTHFLFDQHSANAAIALADKWLADRAGREVAESGHGCFADVYGEV